MKLYNTVWYHEIFDTQHYLQTPEDAFWSRLQDGCKLNVLFKRTEVKLQENTISRDDYIISKHSGLHNNSIGFKVTKLIKSGNDNFLPKKEN